MKIKYFQALAGIRQHLDNVIYSIDKNQNYGNDIGVRVEDREQIVSEREVLRYLIGCQVGAVNDGKALKPSSELAVRCFRRHLDYLERIYGEGEAFHTRFNDVKKQYNACIHYIQMFMDNKWYDKLPNEINGVI